MSDYRAAAGQPKLGRLESDRTGLLLLMEPGKQLSITPAPLAQARGRLRL
jgi:hypothetical protein